MVIDETQILKQIETILVEHGSPELVEQLRGYLEEVKSENLSMKQRLNKIAVQFRNAHGSMSRIHEELGALTKHVP